ncbi:MULTISPECIES: hypothetical protein [Enterobacteriaceae]|uniref:hypothetical protein n=1 Tax=Enterobacteriaceae TaxID=543 RepID=UPI0015DD4DC6|nr:MULTISPECIES: hypothetical protein [unclassified Klebsiella]HAT3953166.1 hypothetical protein [Kluyvera ascorbata]BBS89517.1 hypothetical protein WP7S18C02_01320 [Klebsiella sp. WP7-S18-CRE-02]BBS94539.1 hypothetical protein WP7S18C03_01320 [Klebsiella sp. WP7-S18-CRE-03]BBS99569.1 hypothetical protein WP7S18E04_01320 [Klebsiella sp. WP7-S18-ESBL-04]BBT68831.1 hypothetical protein WP8S18E06_01300 [Klebsiella sp. WP8-S18-ESBL-06]
MSNRHIRRVNLSLHLSPEHSRADLRAMLQLKKWHQTLSQAGNNPGDASMEMRRFHRNVYLAGLQLQLLNPQLCSHVAESMGRETLTLDALCSELTAAQLLPASVAAEPVADAPAPSVDFSKQQLRQMRALMSDALQRQPAPAPAEPDDGMHETLGQLRSEVAQLKALLNQQHLLLQQLRLSGRTAPAAESVKNGLTEEVDLSTLAAPAQKMKQIRQKGIF